MRPFRDERGFTTTSMVLSLLITLALVFTAAQVYRVNSVSAEVQDVADAAALAAENQVAEFMIVARYCDAIVLSLTVTATVVTGLGIAALCVPATAVFSSGLIDAGKNLFNMRNEFSDRAITALNKLQAALPYFSAACAASVARANNVDSSGANYLGVAILVPQSGDSIQKVSDDRSDELLEDIDSKADEIRESAQRAEEASQEANRAKERAFARDCGDNPGYCMYERASRLTGLSGRSNPLYSSVDAWSFSVALNRAKAYYRSRLANEQPASGAIDEQARSSLREKYYRFVVEELEDAYVHETADSFEANIPHLPSNTEEMRRSSLYTDPVYPITVASSEEDDGKEVMHAWMGCPEVQAHGVASIGSIEQMEEGDFSTCPVCGFVASSMGKVAAASSSIENGFEYHYEAVADEAQLYEKARQDAQGPSREVKNEASSLFDELGEVLKESAGRRIDPSPPGKYGALAFVVNLGNVSAAGDFTSGFVRESGSLGPRAAVSASTLAEEDSDEGRSVLNSALDGIRSDGGGAVGVAGMILDAWSWALGVYADGQDALMSGVEDGLNGLPLVSASGLGTWAADKMKSTVEGLGLQPAKIEALKPVLVNSGRVAEKEEGSAYSGYLSAKKLVASHPIGSTSLFAGVLTEAERTALGQVEGIGTEVQIASIDFSGSGGFSIPIVIPIPESIKTSAVSAVCGAFDRIRSLSVDPLEGRVWE